MKRPLLSLLFLCLILSFLISIIINYIDGSHIHPYGDNTSHRLIGRIYKQDSDYFYVKIGTSHYRIAYSDVEMSSVPLDEAARSNSSYSEASSSTVSLLKSPHIGSTISFSGTFREFRTATNPGEFDAYSYYHTIKLCGSFQKVRFLSISSHKNPILCNIFLLRQYLENRLFQIFPEEEAGLLSNILLGDKSAMDTEIKELYQDMGLAHILSISGLHLSILGTGFYKLLRHFFLPRTSGMVSSLFMIFYWLLTGCSISATRAVGIFILEMGSYIWGRTKDTPTSLGVIAFFMLCSNPESIRSCSFLLSFGTYLAILYVCPALFSCLKKGLLPQKEARYQKDSLPNRIKGSLKKILTGIATALSFSSLLVYCTLPIQLYFFYEISLLGPVLNLLILPLMSLLLISGILALLLPHMGILGSITVFLLDGIEGICRCFIGIRHRSWNPGCPQIWQILLFYGLLSLCLILCYMKQVIDFLRRLYRFFQNQFFLGIPSFFLSISTSKRGWMVLILMVCSVLTLSVNKNTPETVTFLDVGQGDCIVIYTDAREVYLFDGGSSSRKNIGKNVIEPFLKYYGLHHISGIFLSHSDSDHLNGLQELIANDSRWNLFIDGIYMTYQDELDNPINTTSIPKLPIQKGFSWTSGRTEFTCLHPDRDASYEDTNAASACYLVRFSSGKTLLLTGDVEKEGEKTFTAALRECLSSKQISSVDLLKAAHHGSKYSTSSEFLEATKPQITIISCGKSNRYGHPHKETLERLEAVGSKILTTPDEGAIRLQLR